MIHQSPTFARNIQFNLWYARTNPPRNCNICALAGDIYKSIIIIMQAASVYPYVSRIWFYLNAINIMSSTTFKFQVAYDYVLTFFESQALACELYPLAPAINRLIRWYTQVGWKINGAWNFKNNPKWFLSTAALTKWSWSIIYKQKPDLEFMKEWLLIIYILFLKPLHSCSWLHQSHYSKYFSTTSL